jgi:hypothetical protein
MPFLVLSEWEQRNDGWPRALPGIVALAHGVFGSATVTTTVADTGAFPWYGVVAAFPASERIRIVRAAFGRALAALHRLRCDLEEIPPAVRLAHAVSCKLAG